LSGIFGLIGALAATGAGDAADVAGATGAAFVIDKDAIVAVAAFCAGDAIGAVGAKSASPPFTSGMPHIKRPAAKTEIRMFVFISFEMAAQVSD